MKRKNRTYDSHQLAYNLGSPVHGVAVLSVFVVAYTGILLKNGLNFFLVENNSIFQVIFQAK